MEDVTAGQVAPLDPQVRALGPQVLGHTQGRLLPRRKASPPTLRCQGPRPLLEPHVLGPSMLWESHIHVLEADGPPLEFEAVEKTGARALLPVGWNKSFLSKDPDQPIVDVLPLEERQVVVKGPETLELLPLVEPRVVWALGTPERVVSTDARRGDR